MPELCCEQCGRTNSQVDVLFRVNEKGIPGIYCCKDCKHYFDSKIDPEVFEISEILNGGNK